MLDFSGIPDGSMDVQIFEATRTDDSNFGGRLWQKPAGVRRVFIFAIGGGGGGGAGLTGAAGTDRGGGGGGGSGGVFVGKFIAALLPDTLSVAVGRGGVPAAGGSRTAVTPPSLTPSDNLSNLALCLGGGTGSPSTGSSGGSGGTAASALSNSAFPLALSGRFKSTAGVAGKNGGAAGSAGTLAIALSSHILTGGAGGGGVSSSNADTAGGEVSASGVFGAGIAGGAAGGGTGNPGFNLRKPFCAIGGSGGGTNGAAGAGGQGGPGGYGCGGGGGGGGVTGGTGGKGGDGLVIITSW